jgi:GntR family transcriptional regulator, sialic acid-inducible nan operon repressor
LSEIDGHWRGAEQMRAPLRRRKLYEDVALGIERLIKERQYLPGDRLPSEKEIMNEFGVGRLAVREAMLSLQKMGLVRVSSGERARVTAPTADALVKELSGAARLLLAQDGGVRQFQEARALFEIGLARFAAQRATHEDIDALREALAANGRAIANRPDFMRTDVAFHYAIAAMSRNPIFTSMYCAVVEWLTEQREISGRAPEAARAAFAAHTRIFQAIADHNPTAAQIAMEGHLDQVVRLYWEVKQSSEADAVDGNRR